MGNTTRVVAARHRRSARGDSPNSVSPAGAQPSGGVEQVLISAAPSNTDNTGSYDAWYLEESNEFYSSSAYLHD